MLAVFHGSNAIYLLCILFQCHVTSPQESINVSVFCKEVDDLALACEHAVVVTEKKVTIAAPIPLMYAWPTSSYWFHKQ